MGRPIESWWARYLQPGAWPFWAVHLVAVIGVALVGFSWEGILLAAVLYVTRMWFVTAGYHRYFSHRAFKTSRWFQLVLAIGAQTGAQRGVLWWAAKHRAHHKHSDTENDVHSVRDGFWWAHVGWATSKSSTIVNYDTIKDLSRHRELRVLDRFPHWPAVALAVVLVLVGGWSALVWGFFVSTVVLWHGTFTINSLSHWMGRRRYATGDDSRNSFALALITLGEGWHNNHHHYMSSANQGFRWWEIDISYYVLRVLALVGIVWDVRRAPAHIVAA
jgi:stearoyl-CoA desaturase (Delta-9 desaturase)